MERFFKACESAAILNFVLSLDSVENELLGNNGINLSGGQKQRISIARELYKDIDILILDEATSSLDSETEKEIQSNIEMLRGKYTIIIIAHRLSTVKTADNIFLMGDGSKLAEGSFQSLVESVPSFKRMVEFQGLLS